MIDLQFNYPVLPEQAAELRTQLERLAHNGGPDLLRLAPYPGDAECRESCGDLLGVPADRVVLTAGGHSALLAVLFAAELAGKTIAVEPLTYATWQEQAQLLGIRLVACEMDDEGLLPDSLERLCRQHRIAACYTMPTIHNPTTTTCPVERRRAVGKLAERHGFWIVEDDAYRFLHDVAPPSFLELSPEFALHVESFSKPLFPALKLAALAVPERLAGRVREVVRHTTSGTSTVSGRIVSAAIREGALERTVKAKRNEGAQRQEMARAVLQGFQVEAHPNSWHLWVRMPGGVSADAASDTLAQRGVAVSAARHFAAPGVVAPQAIRLALGAEPDPVRLRSGLEAVAAVLQEG